MKVLHRQKFSRWWTLPLFVIFALIWLFIGIASAQTTLTIRENAEVSGSHILLSDIAEIKTVSASKAKTLAAIQISIVPPIGVRQTIKRALVEYKLKENRIDSANIVINGSDRTAVSTATTIVSGSQLTAEVKEFLADQITYPEGKFTIEFPRDQADITVPAHDLQLRVNNKRIGRLKGRFVVNVEIYNGKRRFQTIPVQTYIRTFEKMVVASNTISYNTIIGLNDLKVVDQESTDFNNDLINDPAILIGMQAKISIRENSPVLLKNLTSPPLIKKGDTIEIEVKRGSVTISCAGTARKNGKLGDMIPVRMSNSRSDIQGLVISSTKVSVQ